MNERDTMPNPKKPEGFEQKHFNLSQDHIARLAYIKHIKARINESDALRYAIEDSSDRLGYQPPPVPQQQEEERDGGT